LIGWLKSFQRKVAGPYKRWDFGVLYAILFLTIFRLSEVEYIVRHKPDILGAIIPALQHPFQGTDWQAPYGLLWYGISELVYHAYPTPQGYVTITALVDGVLMWKIRNHRLVLVLYIFSSWYEFNQAPYNLPPMWMSLLGLWNPWAVLLGPLTKFPDLPNQIAFVFYTPILSTQGNYNRFWQFWFYFLILLPSIGILATKAYKRKREKNSQPIGRPI
jgi:hypothetical protein